MASAFYSISSSRVLKELMQLLPFHRGSGLCALLPDGFPRLEGLNADPSIGDIGGEPSGEKM